MKLCKDCKHIKRGVLPLDISAPIAVCEAVSLTDIDYVNGDKVIVEAVTCWDARKEGAKCGPEGKLFELREPLNLHPIVKTSMSPSRIDRVMNIAHRITGWLYGNFDLIMYVVASSLMIIFIIVLFTSVTP